MQRRPLKDLVQDARSQAPSKDLQFELVDRVMFWKRMARRRQEKIEIERRAYGNLLGDHLNK